MRPWSTIPQLHQFEIKQLLNRLRNHLPGISIIATHLQIPFPRNMEHRWRTVMVMSTFPLVFSNGNWIALQRPSNNFENMHASPRIGAEVALAPVQQTELERTVRLAVNKAVQQVSVQRANMINALKRKIEDLQSKILELTQGDIGSNITRICNKSAEPTC